MTVYFVQAGEGGPIKIGAARDITRRLVGLQTACPDPLRLLGTIAGNDRKLHPQFAAFRIRGEWFTPHPDLLKWISVNTERPHYARRLTRLERTRSLAGKRLCTADEIVDALGGTMAVAAVCHVGAQAVSNWRAANRIAPGTYEICQAALHEIGCSAPSHLWSIREPKQQGATA